jgi:signal transduction histidine kinase
MGTPASRQMAIAGDVRAALRAMRRFAVALVLPFTTTDPPPPPAGRWRRLAATVGRLGWIASGLVFVLGIISFEGNYVIAVPLAPAMAALYALPLGIVRRAPLRAWRLVAVAAVISPFVVRPEPWQTLPWPVTQTFVAVVVCSGVAARHRLTIAVAVWAWTALAMMGGLYVLGAAPVGDPWPGAVAITGVTMLVGYLVGTRGDLARRVDEGERLRRRSETERAVLAERARVARELHDVVAHHMSMISVQAETAPYRVRDLGEGGAACLADISDTAREALAEMRRLLGVLRDDGHDAQLAPQPDLARLPHLLTGARRAGLTVESTISGDERPLPPGVQLSAYRIVQEALSNVARHAPDAAVRVELAYDDTALRITVANAAPPRRADRPATGDGGDGHGLLGMGERAALHGGTVTAGPTDDGGYHVDATLALSDPPGRA